MANAPVETKVKAASGTALVATFVVAWIVFKAPLLAGAAEPLQAAIIGILGSLSAGIAGWLAKHTPRPADPAHPVEQPMKPLDDGF